MMGNFLNNRRDRELCRRLACSMTLVFMLTAAAWAQSPSPAAATQADASAAPDPADPPSPPSDANADTEAMFPHFKNTRFWLSGQTNFIFQALPGFHADYSGPHSLGPDYEKATSRVMTLYTGVRLNSSTELLVDIEEAGGSALSQGFGLAGNTDLDIVRNPLLSKAPYLGRGMIHKVFALSKDKVENQRSYLSLFDELPRRRLEIRFGKFSMPDFFDLEFGRKRHPFSIQQLGGRQHWHMGLCRRYARLHRGLGGGLRRSQLGFPLRRRLMPKIAQRHRPGVAAVAGPCRKLGVRAAPWCDPEEGGRGSACSHTRITPIWASIASERARFQDACPAQISPIIPGTSLVSMDSA